MIDLKTLAQHEATAKKQEQDDVVEVVRLAMRYLALREHGILLRQEAVVFDVTDLDAAADRLLECGE